MSRRAAGLLAWALCAVAIVAAGALIWLRATAPSEPGASESEDLTFALSFLAFAPVGALIASRRPESPIGWLACGVGLFTVVATLGRGYAVWALILEPGSLPAGGAAAMVAWSVSPLGFACFAFLILLFPDARLPSRRWRWLPPLMVGSLVAILAVGVSVGSTDAPSLLADQPPGGGPVELVLNIATGVFFASLVVCLSSMLFRFRRSRGIERQQLKWLAYVASIVAALLAFEILSGGAVRVAQQMLDFTVLGLPIAVGIAILKYRLYDIDSIINKTLVYGGVTALLALGYAGGVLLAQAVLPVTDDSPALVAITTLAVVALFRPLRSRVQGFVDRRFYRRRYDAARTIESFGSRLRQETDIDSLRRELLALIGETMQPAHASLWLASHSSTQREETG